MLFDKERVKLYYFTMIRSIFLTLGFYACIQLFFTGATGFVAELPGQTIALYFCLILLYHALIAFLLLKNRLLFSNPDTGAVLNRINIANRITLFRITSLPTVYYLFDCLSGTYLNILFPIALAILFLSDMADGFLARKLKQITRIGQMLDSIGDYSLIGLISIIYLRKGILPLWLFAIILFRLFFQASGMLLFILLKKPVPARSTPGGKISIAAIMALYSIELIKIFSKPELLNLVRTVEMVTGLLIGILIFEKLLIFIRQGKASPKS